jgi:hypothetical protein
LRARRQANLSGTLGNLLSRAANRKLLPDGVLPVPTRFDAAADAPLVRALLQVRDTSKTLSVGCQSKRATSIWRVVDSHCSFTTHTRMFGPRFCEIF